MNQVAIQIPDDLMPFIDRTVESGLFSNASEFVVNLLYNVRAETETGLSSEQEAKLATLRAAISIGLEQADRGEFAEFNAEYIIASGRVRHAAEAN